MSGKFTGAVQIGGISYDWTNLRTREDQALIAGPSVKTSFTSDNMTEWFHGSTWYYMDWTTGICQTDDFGFGQVKPDFLVNPLWPHQLGTTFIDTYELNSKKKDFVNCSWIQVDGSAGFNNTAGSSLFEWYLDVNDTARRMRMPSSLSSDLIVELRDYKKTVDPTAFDLPSACTSSPSAWPHGPQTPLARRYAALAKAFNN